MGNEGRTIQMLGAGLGKSAQMRALHDALSAGWVQIIDRHGDIGGLDTGHRTQEEDPHG